MCTPWLDYVSELNPDVVFYKRSIKLRPHHGAFILQYSISKSCASSVIIQRATSARDNVAGGEAKVELELDSAKE